MVNDNLTWIEWIEGNRRSSVVYSTDWHRTERGNHWTGEVI